ncbi:MAG: UDP-N-acetylmuramate--L-alanine ligase [Lachnospiraceae bacterium]|nr:UDP-N-acetylmuramate--L-alanine ligase [Lachnospiraceae bacterium]MBR1524495.1 UDP-N-acetylmuramate--L-alanine ligase [Lachnospiraceae bacterium]
MKNVHFIGIGGISMSGIAELLLSEGYKVSGSDAHRTEITERLEELGARIGYPQKADNIPEDTDIVVMTAAIHEDNPEFMEAKRRGLKVETRADFLGQIMRGYDVPVAVAGTHGKTTTTAMISEILLAAEADPTISIGGVLRDIRGNFRVGGKKYFVMEACEYTNSYHSFYPRIGIILNVEPDHLDFFKDIEDIRRSFHRYGENIPDDGVLIINKDIEGFDEVAGGLKCRVITFGSDDSADYYADNIVYDEFARPTFDVHHEGKVRRITLGVCGSHNVINALSAIAAADELDINEETVKTGLKNYTGTDRRFEVKGKLGGVTIIDDYAHHPTEIRATLSTAKKYPHRDLWVVFQSHTYTRTKALLDEFADALTLADHVICAEIYAARETDTLGVSGETLAERVKDRGTDSYYFPTFEEIKKFIRETLLDRDLLITMGAGDVVKIGDELLREG